MPSHTTESPSSSESSARWRAFFSISLVSIITTLDSSVVNVSLPVISKNLGAGIGVVEWVVMSYMLAIASLLMIFGRFGDMHGRKHTYQSGIILFTAASALCGFSQNITMLIAARTLQGIGAALIIAVGPALIGEIFPPQQRGKALGLLGTTVSVGLSIGPALGGLITGWLGWRYIFFLNLPLGVLAAWLVNRNLRADSVIKRIPFDFPGGIALAMGLFCAMLMLSRGNDWGWGNTGVISLGLGALLFLGAFLRIETRTTEPLLDLTLFTNTTFRSATAAGYLAFASLFAQTFLLPFYLIQLRGFPPAYAGLFLMAVPSAMAVVAPTSGALSDRIGTRGLCSVGLFIQGVSFILLSTLQADSSQSSVVACLLVLGLGIGMFNPPNNADLLSSVARERLGNAGGVMGLTRTLGMVSGVAFSGSIFAGVRKHFLLGADPTPGSAIADAAFMSGLRWAFWVAAGFAWLGMVLVWGREKRRENP
ncbi:MAG: MFS transporter [bacterium]